LPQEAEWSNGVTPAGLAHAFALRAVDGAASVASVSTTLFMRLKLTPQAPMAIGNSPKLKIRVRRNGTNLVG